MYEAIIESIEMGEEEWTSDFSHYETMIPLTRGEIRKDKDRSNELYWCKPYQKGQCNEISPHMALLRPDDPPVPVLHICAHCWIKEHCRAEHAESECSKK